MEKRGRVFIAPVGLTRPDGTVPADTEELFWASWQDADEQRVDDDVYLSSAEEAIAWGRARAATVLIRIGATHYSAGEAQARDAGGDPLPSWPPRRTSS